MKLTEIAIRAGALSLAGCWVAGMASVVCVMSGDAGLAKLLEDIAEVLGAVWTLIVLAAIVSELWDCIVEYDDG